MVFDVWPRLENADLLLEKMSLSDAKEVGAMMEEEEVYRYEPTYLPERLAKSPESFVAEDCDALFQKKQCLLLGIYAKGDHPRFLGIAELYDYVPSREKISIGYRLKKEFWHQGYGTQVVGLLKDYALQDLGLRRLTAHVQVANPASRNCLLHNGFVQRRDPHEEDWGHPQKVIANKYVVYPEGE